MSDDSKVRKASITLWEDGRIEMLTGDVPVEVDDSLQVYPACLRLFEEMEPRVADLATIGLLQWRLQGARKGISAAADLEEQLTALAGPRAAA